MQTGIHVFHKAGGKTKGAKYLLITLSFPHFPQIFPQEFSTGAVNCGYSFLVHIKICDGFRAVSHFFAGRVFYHGGFFVQKFGLDKQGPKEKSSGAAVENLPPGREISRGCVNDKKFQKRG